MFHHQLQKFRTADLMREAEAERLADQARAARRTARRTVRRAARGSRNQDTGGQVDSSRSRFASAA
ncbi:hypothetical protein OG204_27075 [Streptomyces sp. NBC_01387]|uniref:hypothetical protein n=1 Tax=unclassified Streptomyces TaxID=2593676 RepID=UPI00202459D8|nr:MULTISPECIES: hypothetical protein [unclassified Streptomyces]MCX4547991.1 hypothetical protein [Streptomyces sp. NBC_01500]WSC19662.1 hypothetical protein OIE60_08160 [Streptomyces sp. NBC_01766]WSV53684.1 hypothetical protein OG282_08130 [Streptomyces sp. NBC_01014]